MKAPVSESEHAPLFAGIYSVGLEGPLFEHSDPFPSPWDWEAGYAKIVERLRARLIVLD
jgi:hypothetical protein